MDPIKEDELYDAVSRNDINNVKKNLQKDVNINTICSSGLTPLGAAVHLGNMTICETLIEKYKRTLKDDDLTNHRSKKLCVDLNNDRHTSQQDRSRANIGYFVVQKDVDYVETNRELEIGNDGLTPEGMDALEWDEIKTTTEDSPNNDSSYSSLYKWYADILNRTSDLLKSPPHCDINQIDRYGRTALHYACDRGHPSIVQLLLNAGCNVNHTSADNVTALHLACSVGNCDIVRMLIQAGARINHITNTKTTALHFASSHGFVKIMQVLLQAGAHIDAQDTLDRTPLLRAVVEQHHQAVDLLIRHGARLNVEDINGYTPLCQAVWNNSVPIVTSLILAGAKITQSHYLLHYSVVNNHADITNRLIVAGSVVNLRDESGNTPLILAAKHGKIDATNFLLEHGAQVNLPNSLTGASPLSEAVETIEDSDHLKFKALVEVLFLYGAELETQSNWDTPLFRAIFLQKTKIATRLIQLGADVNFCDSRTLLDAMCVAARNLNVHVAKALIYAGYDLNDMARTIPNNERMKGFYNWLMRMKSNPLTLMELCRIKIRKQMGKLVYFQISQLGLPLQLQRYLELEYID